MWIVKPAAKSRGRGITTFADLPKLLKYVEAGSGSGKSCQWIVQKYMENPLTIAKRKFDMRQWVLVTDWNPLTVYFYHECYARFSAEEYDTSDR
jgi:tubulin monoglycylase TTLL3/8